MEDYSAIKRNEVQIHVTIGVSLRNIMLSKDARHKRPLVFVLNVQNRNREQISGCQGLMGAGDGE